MKNLESLMLAAGLSLAAQEADAQDKDPTLIFDPDPALRAAVMGVNVLGTGVVCSIVAFINDRNVLNDTAACLGGAIIQYTGMEISMHDVPVLPGFARRMVETGTSMIEDTLAGREPFEKLHYELGPMLFGIDIKNKDVEIYWRALPAIGYFYNFAGNNKLDFLNSLSYQTFVFDYAGISTDEKPTQGFTIGNIIAHSPEYPLVIAHENDHSLQYIRYRPLQLLVPEEAWFFQKKLRLRMGEDAGELFMGMGSNIGCWANDNKPLCERRTWNLAELEAYIMETAHEKYTPY